MWRSYLGDQLGCGLTLDLQPGDSTMLSLAWDGRDGAGNPVAPGAYVVRIGLARGDRLVASDPRLHPLTIGP